MRNVWAALVRIVVFHEVCRILLRLFKMAMINVLIYIVLKILYSLVFVQKSLFAITADINKISKSAESDIALILNVLSEKVNSFSVNLFSLRNKKYC